MSSSELDLSNRKDAEESIDIGRQTDTLPYQDGQYRPSNREGHRKYSIEFMRAVLDSMHLDGSLPMGYWQQDDSLDSPVEPVLDSDKLELPYEEGSYSPTNPDGHRRYSIKFLRAVGKLIRSELDKSQQKIEPLSKE